MSQARARPLSVVLAAFIVAGMGLFHCVPASAAAIAAFASPSPPNLERGTDSVSFGPGIGWIDDHPLVFAASQAILALGALGCSIGLWVGAGWARTTGQAVMALIAFVWVVSGVLMAWSISGPAGLGPVGAALFLIWRFAIVGVGLCWSAFSAIPIWLLARNESRLWFEATAG